MGVTRAMEDRRPVYGAPVQDSAEHVQEQNTTDLMPAQEQDSTTEEAQMPPSVVHRKRLAVPIQEKALLTLDEAAEYTGLGLHKLREISNDESCSFILWNGKKRMFKRRKLDEYLEGVYSI